MAGKLILFELVAVIFLHVGSSKENLSNECDKFFLIVENEPEYFVPRSSYVVGIESNNVHTFSSFRFAAQSFNDSASSLAQTGWFSLMSNDADAQFSPDEINTIIEQNDSDKRSVYVLWTAPTGHDCVIIKGEVNYRLNEKFCSQKLSRKFCPLNEKNFFANPTIASDECCACDEASYTMIFEGLWSNETHPQYFPSALQLTHFSDIIGCSHSKNVTMWTEGVYATEGLRQVAEFGSGSIIESELLEKKKHLRSLIKMPGLWYPKMNTNTSTTFRVDRRHNFVSIAAMLGPSPDWFTGISGLNLCTADCTWIQNKVVDLSLYDAGTDSGISYMSPDAPTIPQERVYRISSSYPEDPRAPFYNMQGDEIKPIARLYLQRDHVTQKSCVEEPMFDPDEKLNDIEDKRRECTTTNYTDWSPCSVSCGKGYSVRARKYVDSEAATKTDCRQQLMQKKLCMAEIPCPGETDEDPLLLSNDHCKTTNWTEWSECTATCGIGFMTRTRRFLNHSGFKRCKHVSVFEKKKCMEPPCKAISVEKTFDNCTTTEWTDWSPCTATCGKGFRIRIRYLTVFGEMYEFCKRNVKLEEKRECIQTTSCIVDKAQAKEVCQLAKEKGPCRGVYQRWYFNFDNKKCVEFTYGGCRGNKNNFFSQDECIKTCSGLY